MLDNLGDSLKEKLDKAKDMVDVAAGKVSELKDAGKDKIKSYMDEISNGLPVIEEAGFKTDGISIDLGLPPDVSISFSKTTEVSAEIMETLIQQNEDKKLLVMILKALQSADKMQSNFTFNKLAFAGISIKLGLPPEISLKYR
jgi:hypothetical protein